MENMRFQSIDLLTGSDQLQAYVNTKNLEDVENNMYYTQENMLVGAEGYSNFFLGEDTPLRIVEDRDIILGSSVIRGMANIVGSVISAGPSDDNAWKKGEVLVGLDNLSWFRLTMSILIVTVGLHSYAATLDCIVSFLIPPHRSPCTIRSRV